MNRHCLTAGLSISSLVCALTVALAPQSQAQVVPKLPIAPVSNNTTTRTSGGMVVVPSSSLPSPKQGTTLKTMTAHTNLELYLPPSWNPSTVTPPRPGYGYGPPFAGYAYETPASLACIYSLTTATTGCNPNTVTSNATGGSKTIAIVDAYDDPFAGPDLAYFSDEFGLPFADSQFQVIYESGTPPPVDPTGGWELEESLDIEYAHAEAPQAMIYLVEANSNSYSDLLTAVTMANNLVLCGSTTTCPTGSTGKGEVSMSWGGSEFAAETSYDTYFTQSGVVYFASAGDSPGTEWPCTSPNVVCAGGTDIRRNPSTGAVIDQRAWASTGGGDSLYETTPSYQSSVASVVGTARGVPDLSFDADPITGVWVWSSYELSEDYFDAELPATEGWWIVGGTSVSSPNLAGIVNRAGAFAASSNAELTTIYANKANTADFSDIGAGWCGPYGGYSTLIGWDFCTGVGNDRGYAGK
jgi:kumamolisin